MSMMKVIEDNWFEKHKIWSLVRFISMFIVQSVSQQGYVNYMYYSMGLEGQGSALLNFPGYAEPLSDYFWPKARPTPAPHSKKLIHSDRKAGYIGWYTGRLIYFDR